MKHLRVLSYLLILSLFFTGCAAPPPPVSPETTLPPPQAQPVITDPDAVVAWTEDTALTLGALQIWYWAEVSQYRQSQAAPAPDFSLPLDAQACALGDQGDTWQDYFRDRAIRSWHTAQALIHQSRTEPLPLEEAWEPIPNSREKYMTNMPAAEFLYGSHTFYQPNTMHQAWLEEIPQLLTALASQNGCSGAEALAQAAFGGDSTALTAFTEDLNLAYMYFTTLCEDLEPEDAEIQACRSAHADRYADTSPLVTIRHILLTQETNGVSCEDLAVTLLEQWLDQTPATEATFAQLASLHSQDPGSAPNGGLYQLVRQDQLQGALGHWAFDPSREEGDTAMLPADNGWHLVYFCRRTDAGFVQARKDLIAETEAGLLAQARDRFPMEIADGAYGLTEASGAVSASDLLYPDIAHERFPEVPLYLQQDYPHTMYGNYKITTNGCGITSLAMLASYMTDEELTPPEMCAQFGKFSTKVGTDGSLFEKAPPQLGFYLAEKTYDWRVAREYMKEGCLVIVVQYRGYWTSGGHYLVLETLSEDGLVQVRDSNLYNYRKLVRHKEDLFPWDTINGAGMGYWVYRPKVTTTAACTRCGDAQQTYPVSGYLCSRCETALLRRNSYLDA